MLPLSGGKLPGRGQLLFCTQTACEEKLPFFVGSWYNKF